MKRFLLGEGGFANTLIGRIAVVALFSALAAVVLALLFVIPGFMHPVALKFLILTLLGLGTGLLARRLLQGHTLMLRFLVALLAEIVAFSVLNPLTQGFLGINILGYYASFPQWDGLLQFAVAGLGSLLVLIAWRPKVTVAPKSTPQPAPQPNRRRPRRSGSNPFEALAQGARSMQRSVAGGLKRFKASAAATIANPLEALRGGNKSLKVLKPKERKQAAKRRRMGLRRNPGVSLSQVVEHRCPYCLELVEPGDARGVKTCKICHTPHHADCWDVAGVCQVPHEVQ